MSYVAVTNTPNEFQALPDASKHSTDVVTTKPPCFKPTPPIRQGALSRVNAAAPYKSESPSAVFTTALEAQVLLVGSNTSLAFDAIAPLGFPPDA